MRGTHVAKPSLPSSHGGRQRAIIRAAAMRIPESKPPHLHRPARESFMRWITCFITVLLASTANSSPADDYAVPLVKEGRAVAQVALPPGPTATLTTAADEIVAYVEKISARGFPSVACHTADRGLSWRSPQNRCRRRMPSNRYPARRSAARRWWRGGRVLCGLCLLEDLGVRWLVPGPKGRSDLHCAAASPIRGPIAGKRPGFAAGSSTRMPETLLWAVRNRLNGFFPQRFAAAHGNSYYLPPVTPSLHSLAHLLPPEKYFAAHPEYYASWAANAWRAPSRTTSFARRTRR